MKRGVARLSAMPWSLLAPDSTRNRTTSRCPWWAATKRGVLPLSAVPWSLLAPDPTRKRTTSRCPSWAATKRGVISVSLMPWSWLAPASISKDTHLRLPFRDAAHKGVITFASSKLGFRGWFKCCSRSLSSLSSHATMMPWSCSLSGSWNSRITSCTTWRVQVWFSIKIWLSSSGELCWRSRSRKRGTPIFCAKRCFKAFTEPSATSTSSKTAIDSPVTAESTSSMGQLSKKAQEVRNKSEYHCFVKTPRTKSGCPRIMHPQNSRNSNNNNNNNIINIINNKKQDILWIVRTNDMSVTGMFPSFNPASITQCGMLRVYVILNKVFDPWTYIITWWIDMITHKKYNEHLQ